MNFQKSKFGEFEGQDVFLLTVENKNGIRLKVMNYGITVTSLLVPDKNGQKDDIVCGFNRFESYFSDDYKENSPYFGCIIGRYTGRIKNARFVLNGKTYQLAANDPPNHIHGGFKGFDKHLWNILKTEQDEKQVKISFQRVSPDGEENYPGNLDVICHVSLNNQNELIFEYEAETDKPTPVSLTNHSYFNLNGFKDKILDHVVQINARQILEVDENNVPTDNRLDIGNTSRDLRHPKRLADCFEELPTGFEDYYVFGDDLQTLKEVAVIGHRESGRLLKVLTTEPGMLFYTGKYTSDKLSREDGTQFGQYRAFCCETSRFPNGPNIANSPGTFLNPGEKYYSKTIYRFEF